MVNDIIQPASVSHSLVCLNYLCGQLLTLTVGQMKNSLTHIAFEYSIA